MVKMMFDFGNLIAPRSPKMMQQIGAQNIPNPRKMHVFHGKNDVRFGSSNSTEIAENDATNWRAKSSKSTKNTCFSW